MIKIIKQGNHRTIKRAFSISATSPYIENHQTNLIVQPNEKGIVFVSNGKEITVSHSSNVYANGIHATFLNNGNGGTVKLSEHLLSALTGMGVTAARLVLDTDQVPVPDRCAETFCREIENVGIEETDSRLEVAVVTEDIWFEDNGSFAFLRPSKIPKISALVQFAHLFEDQYLKVNLDQESYWNEIMWARPFIRVDCPDEASYLTAISKLSGMPKNIAKSTVLVRSNGKWVTGIKPQEPVRHKILDAIGDLTTFGYPIIADISLVRPGHDFHRKLVNYLNEKKE
jgi:UDP-3-O-[3-hydroxymyristoyl] N-acetylglucosamine deacetylase